MASTLLLALALGAWGPRGCPPVGGLVAAPVMRAGVLAPRYEWRKIHGSKTQYLHDRGRLVGGWDQATDTFRWFQNGAWTEPTAKPWGAPTKMSSDPFAPAMTGEEALGFEQLAQQPVPNYGLDEKRVRQESEPHYRLNGMPVSREQAWNTLVETSALADDSAKNRITVLGGTLNDRARVLGDLLTAPELAPWRTCLVRSYGQGERSDDWQATRYGFVTSGTPTIYLQAADGKVLYRQDDYAGGAPRLAEGLRKHDPNYQPDKDPGRPRPVVPTGLPNLLAGMPLWAWGGGGLLLALLLLTGRTEQ